MTVDFRPSESALDLIGNTPMVKMSRLAKTLELPAGLEIYGKCEFCNAGGSVKDRIALRMVQEAEMRGVIKPGDTLIEATSGNTGIGLSLVGAIRGYQVIVTLPEKMSGEKVNVMKALGADIRRTPTEAAWDSPDSHIGLAKRLAEEIPHSHVLDQYNNPFNPQAHYDGTASEILNEMGDKIDAVFIGTGTGGTLTGIARKFRETLPSCKIIAVDPFGSTLAQPDILNDFKRHQPNLVEGIGYDFVPGVLDRSLVDEWVKVDDCESFLRARDIIRYEGLLVGGSSGSAVAAVAHWVKKETANGRDFRQFRIVVVLPDTCRNYMSKFIEDDWMIERGFLPDPMPLPLWMTSLVLSSLSHLFKSATLVTGATRLAEIQPSPEGVVLNGHRHITEAALMAGALKGKMTIADLTHVKLSVLSGATLAQAASAFKRDAWLFIEAGGLKVFSRSSFISFIHSKI